MKMHILMLKFFMVGVSFGLVGPLTGCQSEPKNEENIDSLDNEKTDAKKKKKTNKKKKKPSAAATKDPV